MPPQYREAGIEAVREMDRIAQGSFSQRSSGVARAGASKGKPAGQPSHNLEREGEGRPHSYKSTLLHHLEPSSDSQAPAAGPAEPAPASQGTQAGADQRPPEGPGSQEQPARKEAESERGEAGPAQRDKQARHEHEVRGEKPALPAHAPSGQPAEEHEQAEGHRKELPDSQARKELPDSQAEAPAQAQAPDFDVSVAEIKDSVVGAVAGGAQAVRDALPSLAAHPAGEARPAGSGAPSAQLQAAGEAAGKALHQAPAAVADVAKAAGGALDAAQQALSPALETTKTTAAEALEGIIERAQAAADATKAAAASAGNRAAENIASATQKVADGAAQLKHEGAEQAAGVREGLRQRADTGRIAGTLRRAARLGVAALAAYALWCGLLRLLGALPWGGAEGELRAQGRWPPA